MYALKHADGIRYPKITFTDGREQIGMEEYFDEEDRRRLQHMRERQERKRKEREKELRRNLIKLGIAVVGIVIVAAASVFINFAGKKRQAGNFQKGIAVQEGSQFLLAAKIKKESPDTLKETDNKTEIDGSTKEQPYHYAMTEDTVRLSSEVGSSHAIFLDLEKGTVLACKDATSRIVPASMTKVLTLLVAVEHIENLNDTFTITQDITDYCFVNDCSVAGYEKEEKVTIKDMLYATVLPSGADAALGLAVYVSGSQEAFVELMNAKLEELGLSETAHFTNCVGIYEADHYCTMYDMAMILDAALQNETCLDVLSARTYVTSKTEQHPEGIPLSNWFIRRIEDKDTGGLAVGGKTGDVEESGSCAASFGSDPTGKTYICVTANASSKWGCIDDHAYMYKRFAL